MRAQRLSRLLLYLILCTALTLFIIQRYYNPNISTILSRENEGPLVPPSAIISLVKHRDLPQVIEMIRNVEDRFNRKYNYDWVFLSEEDFKPEFEAAASAFTSGKAYFRTVNRKQHWKLPANIERNRLMNSMQNLNLQGVPYGGSTTYRHMCRFYSGFFMEYLPEYRYFMRIDSDVKLYCDIEEDIFATMHNNNKKLGFTISLHEVPYGAQDLSKASEQFMGMNSALIRPNQWMDEWVKPAAECCHFWTNFEVGDLDFFRSESYRKFFKHLDESGGIFYNRWGDAPIHAVAASLFLDPSEVHWFGNIGSYHKPLVSCPTSEAERLKLRCTCPTDPYLDKSERNAIFTYSKDSCTPQFLNLSGQSFSTDWEKYADRNVIKQFGGDKGL